MGMALTFRSGALGFVNTTASDASGNSTDTFGPITLAQLFGDGVAAGLADRGFHETRSLSTAAYTYTLSALPGSQALVKDRLLFVQVTAGSGSLAIAPGSTHGWTGVTIGLPLQLGSILLVTWPALAGAAVASGVTDQITFTATGAVTYIVAFAGTSA